MPRNIDQAELGAILESGNFSSLMGVLENEWFECKSEPYLLENDYQKQEFAKDISSFANAKGGFILIGVATRRLDEYLGDEIISLSQMPRTLISPEQYFAVLNSWIYSTIDCINLEWFQSQEDTTNGLFLITIPLQVFSRYPFLIKRIISDTGRRVETVFGYNERRRSNSEPASIHEIHTLIRNGLLFESLNQRFENIEFAVQDITNRLSGNLPEERQELLEDRIQQAIEQISLTDFQIFILSSKPTPPLEFPDLFSTRYSPIVNLIQNPPTLRSSGFDLNIGNYPSIIRGQLRRTGIAEYKSLELWRDGTLIFIARADGEFLSWGRHSTTSTANLLNPIALIESTYLFIELTRQLYEMSSIQPDEIQFRIDLRNLNTSNTVLIPGPVGTLNWMFRDNAHHAPDSNWSHSLSVSSINPQRSAFLLIKEIYLWFGIEEEYIPYTSRIDGNLQIDPGQLRDPSRRI